MDTICLNSTTVEHFIITLNCKSVSCQGLAISHDLQCNIQNKKQRSRGSLTKGQSDFSNTNITKDTHKHTHKLVGFPGGLAVKNLPAMQEMVFSPWVGKIPWRRKWQPTPVFLQVYNPTDRGVWWATVHRIAESDTIVCVSAHTHTHILVIIQLVCIYLNTSKISESEIVISKYERQASGMYSISCLLNVVQILEV